MCTAYGVEWPIPPSADGPQWVPGWAVADDEAELLRMTLPAYLEWSATEQGQWWLPRLRLKWTIVAEARRLEYADREHGDGDGWRGGRCDPHEFSIFDDDDDAAA